MKKCFFYKVNGEHFDRLSGLMIIKIRRIDNNNGCEGFLYRKNFTFTHITNAEFFIKYISTSPYPENIFIDTQGYIRYVEGGISGDTGSTIYFEEIIEELLNLH
jgi:hypothetical protein